MISIELSIFKLSTPTVQPKPFLTGLTTNKEHGDTAQIATAVTGRIAGLAVQDTVVHGWYLDDQRITGAVQEEYTPLSQDDLKHLRYVPEINGTLYFSADCIIRHAPPFASGNPVDLLLSAGVGLTPIDLTRNFGGSDLRYSLAPSSPAALPAGFMLGQDGFLTGTPEGSGAEDSFIIQAENSGGTAETLIRIRTERNIESAGILSDDTFTIQLTHLLADLPDGLALSALALDGISIFDKLQDPAVAPELATVTAPRRKSGSGAIVSALKAPLDIGALYLVSYEILADKGTKDLYFTAKAGGPFASQRLPFTVGVHHILVRAEDGDTAALMRLVGDLTFGFVSCRKAEWSMKLPKDSAGKHVSWTIRTDDAQSGASTFIPQSGIFYVSPQGSDTQGTGAMGSPFRQPGHASQFARPGDTVYMRPGIYDPFEVQTSGTSGNPITYTTLPGEERQAIISGRKVTDAYVNGINIFGKDHIHIRNLIIEDMTYAGISILGLQNEQHGHHILAGNLTRRTGGPGIFVMGYAPHQTLAASDIRTIDILIEGNDVSETNLPTSLSKGVQGVNEAISVAAGVDGIITRNNFVHDSLQYGIDYKLGVINGEIHGNTIWNIEKYGIYLDSARRFVTNIRVYNNLVHSCDIGITLAREAVYPGKTYRSGDLTQTLKNIDVFNNVFYNIGRTGILCHRHPTKDTPHGKISDIRIRFNTLYNCGAAADVSDIRINDWAGSGWKNVLSGFDIIGNIVWRDNKTGKARIDNLLSSMKNAVITENLVDTDPLFVNTNAKHPDLSLKAGSPAIGSVSKNHATPPFNVTANGKDRTTPPTAGAL